MKQALVNISLAVLKEILKLPPETRLLRVRQDWEHERQGAFQVLVESPELHEIPEGEVFPETTIEIHSDFCPSHELGCVMGSRVMP